MFLVKGIVCDYGVYKDEELVCVCSSRTNALLIADILNKDCRSVGGGFDYTYNLKDAEAFFKGIVRGTEF